MAERKLITPRFRITVGDQVFTQGIRVECHSNRREQCSWATLNMTPVMQGSWTLPSMAPAQVELGYDGDYDTLLTGYMADGQALGPYRILDDTLFLKRTYVKERPSWTAARRISSGSDLEGPGLRITVCPIPYTPKGRDPGSAHECGGAYPGGGTGLGAGDILLFPVRPVLLGTGERSRRFIYVLEEGKNILSFNQWNGGNEIKTIGVPWIHQGERIRIRHRKFDGEAL